MPTNLAIDDDLLREALRLGGHASKRATVNEALKELNVSPDQYLLEMNPQTNTWLLKTNAQAVMAKQVTEAEPVEAVKPAGDTENKAEVENTVALPVPM